MSDVTDFLSAAKIHIDDVASEALDAADRLESIASLPFQIWIDFPAKTAAELTKVPPVSGTEDIPELERVDIDLSMVADFDPSRFQQATYLSSFFDFLEPKLTDFIENGGPGISEAVQTALFDNMRERDLQLLSDALDQVRGNYGKRGFPLPTSMLRAQENEIVKKYQDDRSNRNREITVLLAERAQDTMKAAVSAGIRMEEVQSQFSLGFARLFTEVSNQLIAQYRLMQDAALAEFEGQIKTIVTKAQVGEVNARLDMAYNEQVLKQWEIESEQAIEKTKARIAQAEQATQVKLEAARGLSEFYKGMVLGFAGQANGIAVQSEDISAD